MNTSTGERKKCHFKETQLHFKWPLTLDFFHILNVIRFYFCTIVETSYFIENLFSSFCNKTVTHVFSYLVCLKSCSQFHDVKLHTNYLYASLNVLYEYKHDLVSNSCDQILFTLVLFKIKDISSFFETIIFSNLINSE